MTHVMCEKVTTLASIFIAGADVRHKVPVVIVNVCSPWLNLLSRDASLGRYMVLTGEFSVPLRKRLLSNQP